MRPESIVGRNTSFKALATALKRTRPSQIERVCGSATTIAFVAAISLLTTFLDLTSASVARAATITLSPGNNIQTAINSNPAGTTFSLQPGVYRTQSLVPLDGDTFIGLSGAVLDGSQVLTNWVQSGSYWVSSGNPALNSPFGAASHECQSATSGCAYPQDLYLNGKPLVHELALPIVSG